MGTKLGKTYPHTWTSGPDPVRHKLYLACQRARAQAKYRNQEWHITEDEYCDLWIEDDRYMRKNRSSSGLSMTRIDKEKPWTVDNVEFMTRAEHLAGLYRGVPVQERTNEYSN